MYIHKHKHPDTLHTYISHTLSNVYTTHTQVTHTHDTNSSYAIYIVLKHIYVNTEGISTKLDYFSVEFLYSPVTR